MNEFLFDDKPFDLMRSPKKEKVGIVEDSSQTAPFISDLLGEIGKIRVEIIKMQRRVQAGMTHTSTSGGTPSSPGMDSHVARDVLQCMQFLEVVLSEVKGVKPEILNLREKAKDDNANDFAKNLFQVVDAFQRVFDVIPEDESDPKMKGWFTGIRQIYNTLMMVLRHHGFEEIEALNKMFNPKMFAAVGTVKDPEKPNGLIVKVQRIGFLRKGIPVRFPEVIVVRND